ncbi:glycoside hydrolase family 10 protein [Pantanalinema sp. GBBB05]|uniref:glycoside hydrolase family 10 protein n=1 Tax=Pantanalinema sp. GBBB05 TaxID=2604139 RepID=UPI001DBD5763|nr:family 10 glycosylhydrolase [Pantanalinema sp. GBBB05]
MVTSPPRFPDIQNHWARLFIEGLAQRNIVRGFPDGTFRPDQAVTRAEFAILLQTAFSRPIVRPPIAFTDVPTSHWAINAIRYAYQTNFLTGYPGQQFRPNEKIPRVQALAALAGGLGFTNSPPVVLSELYQDSAQIPSWATTTIAAATANEIVVNYPTLSQLRPTQATTRGEVSACIYQCLVQLGQTAAIASAAIVRPVPTVTISHRRELRAAWVACVWNSDFPSATGLSTQQQQTELMTILDRMQALNFNTLIFQVRPEGDAMYASSLEPWSNWLTGTQGQAPNPFYDPLEFVINQAHQRNIEVHAWFNPYRARTSQKTVNVRPHMAVTHPTVVYTWGNQLWADPGAKVIQDRTYNVIMDVVRRYDVDGIHLDDYFYPYPIAGQTFPDNATYQAYRNSGGTLALADWRRENVNTLIQRLLNGIRATKPYVKFGISPFGIYRPGQPPQIQGLDAYNQLYADSLKWLQQGWVDYLAPQLYWRIDPPAQSYPVLLEWWISNNPKQRHVYAGNNLSLLDGKSWELSEIERQVELTRQLRDRGAIGNIFFSMDALLINRQGVTDRFQSATYQTLALPPSMSWLAATPPTLPTGVRVANGKLTWNPATSEVRSWTLYQQTSAGWTLRQVLPASTSAFPITSGTYAICAVNRLAQESAGVVIKV